MPLHRPSDFRFLDVVFGDSKYILFDEGLGVLAVDS